MLGLLLMASLGFAATAIMEHMDVRASDDPQSDEDGTPDATTHGSLLDDDTDPSHDDPAAHQDTSAPDDTTHTVSQSQPAETPASDQHVMSNAPFPLGKVFGTAADDTLQGSAHADLMEGNGGDDLLYGKMGKDHLIGFDEGSDTLFGNRGDDTLHGYLVQDQPDGTSFVIEDHQADHLNGGLGNDKLLLGSDDVGSGGQGADEFHVSWDVGHGHPAQITDYNPKQDKLFIEFTNNHADEGMTEIKPQDTALTTAPMKDGTGTAILLNGQTIAHVLGATYLNAADIGLIHA